MKTETVKALTEAFKGNAHYTDTGVEFWLGRDLQHLLGYAEWRSFTVAVSRAKTACEVSGHPVADHFVDVTKMVDLGSGSQREIDDLMLTTQAMQVQWRVPDNRPLADFAPTIILKAKDFAAEITIFNARQHQMGSEGAISREHIANNEAVRKTLLERGIRPETLPPAEDVRKTERRLVAEDKKSWKKPDALDH